MMKKIKLMVFVIVILVPGLLISHLKSGKDERKQ